MAGRTFWKSAGRFLVRLAPLCGIAAMVAALYPITTCAQGAGRQLLGGHVPEAIARLRLPATGRLPATNGLNLAIGLPLRNQAELAELLRQLYDPASPNFRKFLTPEEFAARFGPTEADYAAVMNFARTNGLVVTGTYGNRLLLDVAGPAAAVENAFHVTLRTYRHPTENRDFFAPDSEPAVDATLPVVDVQGLSDFPRPHPKLYRADLAGISGKTATPNSGSGPVVNGVATYVGNDFRNAYAPGSALNGSGQAVGLLQFDGYYASDITAYESLAGRTNIPLQRVLIDGFSGTPTTGANSGNDEVSLDIEMAMSMAPALARIVVFEGNPSGTHFIPNDVLNTMLASNTVKNLSCSWGWSGGPTATTDNIFTNMAAQGQSFFDASGDSDAFPPGFVDNSGNTTVPSSSPYITEVGGTTLTMNGTGASYASETVWNWNLTGNPGVGSSGGVSSYYPIPVWQQGVNSFLNNGGSTTMRNIPDVALTADNVYVLYGSGSSGMFGGTSCAAPLWAGFMALANQQAAAGGQTGGIGFINPAVYEIANESIYNSAFNDITTGNNTWASSPNAFYAVPGYDLCTGLGTPAGVTLINALVNPDPLVVVSNGGFNAVGAFGGTFNVAPRTFYVTNAGTSSLTWSLVNTSSWLNVSGGGGALAAGAGSSVTVGLNAIVAGNLPPGIYTVNLAFSNVTSGVTHYRFFSLTVNDALAILPTNSFSFTGPSGGPFNPATQTITLTNTGSGVLNWGINNTSSWFNVSPSSGSLASGAQAAVTITPASAMTSLPDGTYAASLQVTNLASQFVQTVAINVIVSDVLVQNGGFETGNFTGWTETGATTYMSVVSGSSTYVHSGTYGAELGPAGALSYLSQTLPTSPGQAYLLSFWLSNPNAGSSRHTEQFQASWNGTTITNITNPAAFGWTQFTFRVSATGASTVLQFGFRNDSYYFGFDDVSVIPIYPPSISTQPANQAVVTGGNAAFTVTAGGAPPLVYQWRKSGTNISNGGNISGATTNILTFTAATTNNSGNYTVVITNAYGSVTSSVATLTIAVPPSITSSSLTNQTVQCGSNSPAFAVTAAGTPPLNYQWSFDGVPVSNATNASYSLVNVHLPSHTIGVVVTNSFGSISSNAVLTVQDTIAPAITLNGGNPMFVELGGIFTDPGTTATDLCAGAVAVIVSGSVNTGSAGTNILTYTAGDGSGNTNSVTRTVIVTTPAILWSFTNLIVAANTNCSAVMTNVTGTNFILAADLAGALTISQIPTNTAPLPVGTNIVVITVKDASGNAAYSTNTIVVKDVTPPLFLIQPQSRTNIVGTTANFSAGASACTPLAYQWLFNKAPLSGQTNSALAIVSVNPASAGNYSVVAAASGGSTTSAVARLTVDLIPASLALNSSDNPAGFRDSLNFTAAMTPAGAMGSVQFFTNGFYFDGEPLVAGTAASVFTAALPRGTNQITAIYSGDANDLPATNSLAQIVTNHPPVATDYATKRFAGLPLDIPVANLSSNWSDADGDTVSLAAIGVSTNGVTVTNSAGTLIYWNTNDVDDAFVCTITDGWGGTNFQNVYLTVVPLPNNAKPAISSLVVSGGNTISLNLAGASGFTYVLETSTNLGSPGAWLPIATNVVGTNGVWQFSGAMTNSPHQFYRLRLTQ